MIGKSCVKDVVGRVLKCNSVTGYKLLLSGNLVEFVFKICLSWNALLFLVIHRIFLIEAMFHTRPLCKFELFSIFLSYAVALRGGGRPGLGGVGAPKRCY